MSEFGEPIEIHESFGVSVEGEVGDEGLVHAGEDLHHEVVFQQLHQLRDVLLAVQGASVVLLNLLFCLLNIILKHDFQLLLMIQRMSLIHLRCNNQQRLDKRFKLHPSLLLWLLSFVLCVF
jgi:hypothetical protein